MSRSDIALALFLRTNIEVPIPFDIFEIERVLLFMDVFTRAVQNTEVRLSGHYSSLFQEVQVLLLAKELLLRSIQRNMFVVRMISELPLLLRHLFL